MDLSHLAVGLAGFVVGGALVGALVWFLAAARAQALAGVKAQLGDTFQAMAAQALRASQEGFLTLATEKLGAARKEAVTDLEARREAQQKLIEGVVGPVRASLEKVDEHIRALERERGTAYGALRQQLHTIAETQERLREATGSLVGALKAPAVRGRWGEMQLRRVVELAGMIEHCDFHEQTTAQGEDGRIRPDLVVRLAGGRNIVVDAKVPLGAYLEAHEAKDDETRAARLRQHAAQVQAHVRKLSAKSYWEGFGAAPELVVMFLPGESLYTVALEQMPGLIEEGVAQRVLIATPTTLLALLRAISYGWREERLAENAQRISEEGRRLHERLATLLDHFADLGRSLGQSVKHFNAAIASFNQRVMVSARRLEELDARGKKVLPEVTEIEVRPVIVPPVGGHREESEPPRPRRQASLALALSPTPDPE